MNYLNRPWKELFDLPNFKKVKEEDFLPALKDAIYLARQNIERIAKGASPPNFYNTIEPLELFDDKLSRLSTLFFNLVSSNSNEKLESINQIYTQQLELMKDEVKELRNKIKQSSSGKEKDHIRESFVQWLGFLASNDPKEDTIMQLLQMHLNVSDSDKQKVGAQVAIIKNLFPKQKSKKGWFGK